MSICRKLFLALAIAVASLSMTGVAAPAAGQSGDAGIGALTKAARIGGTDPRDYGAKCDGSNDDSADFASADRAVAGAVVVVGNCRFGKSVALNHPVMFAPSAMMTLGDGVTLTLAVSPLAMPVAPIFAGPGRVAIAHPQTDLYPQWWGCKADNRTDCAPALQAAVDALSATGGGTVRLLPGNYKLGCAERDAVTISGNRPVNIEGSGNDLTFLRPMTNCAHTLLVIDGSGRSGDLRDFAVAGDQLFPRRNPAVITDAIRCMRCGVSDISHLLIEEMHDGLVLYFIEGSVVADVEILYNTGIGVILGGYVGTSQHVSITQFNDLMIFCAAPQEKGTEALRIDNGANELVFRRFIGGSCERGIHILKSVGNGHPPEGIRFFDGWNINNDHDCDICISDGRYLEFHGGASTAALRGPSVDIAASDGHCAVDGVWLDGGLIGGTVDGDGVLIRAGCNVSITNNRILTIGARRPNTYCAIHATARTYGLLEIKDDMMGTSVWGNLGNRTTGCAVDIEDGALADYTDDRRVQFGGRLVMTGNVMGGVGSGEPYHDGSVAKHKLIANNLLE